MTIEINRAHSPYIYRQNPFNPRIIDRRENKHNARWQTYQTCASAAEARKTIYELERHHGETPL